MRQNKLFSAIYIGGTAIAIAATTIFAIIYYVKLAPIYPEYDRMKMYTIDRGEITFANGLGGQSHIGYDLVVDMVQNLKNVKKITTFREDMMNEDYMKASDGETDVRVIAKLTDPQFFDIYQYDFIDGRSYSQSEFENGARVAVVSATTAEKALGSSKGALGKKVWLNFADYEIVGVVRDGSSLVKRSFADIFVPYKSVYGYDIPWMKYLGSYKNTIITDSPEELREEVSEFVRRYNSSQGDYSLNLYNQPVSFVQTAIQPYLNNQFSWADVIKDNLIILLVLLLVPALNLSGMISSRMEMRMGELGIRKSFGATRRALLGQVLWENLLLTCVGGLLGLVITWIALAATGASILTLTEEWIEWPSATPTVLPEMMFSPAVFLIAFGLCLVLNIASAVLPAWLGLRHPIVQSLKER